MSKKDKGLLLVVSGPSGVGKGTVGKRLIASDDRIRFSVSVTTRARREGEREGVDYDYISEEEFASLEARGKLLESALVHGNHYGTPADPVDKSLEEGMDVLLEIDPQGAGTVIRKRPDCVSVFVLPPSWASLRRRLENRGTETREQVEMRLANARKEVETVPMYDYVIVNEDGPEGIENAFRTLQGIVRSEKCRVSRYEGPIPEEQEQ